MNLLIEDDEGHRTLVPVIREEITIGRREGHTVRLTERNVSRDHARIVKVDDQLFIEDVDARYGVQLNGAEIDGRAPFDEGDVVHIGDYRLTLRPEDVQSGEGSDDEAVSPDTVVTRPQPTVGGAPDADSPEPKDEETEEFGALTVVSRHDPGRTFELDSEALVIGRSDECDIVLNHRSVSSRHARVVREGDDYRIIDLDSSNGVKVDGEHYRSMPLEPGDVIGLGHVELRFVGPGESWQFARKETRAEPSSPEAPDEVSETAEVDGSDEDRGVVVLGAFGIVLVAVVAVVAIRLHEPAQPDEATTTVAADADERRSAGKSETADPESNPEGSKQVESERADSKRSGSSPSESEPSKLAASETEQQAEPAPSEPTDEKRVQRDEPPADGATQSDEPTPQEVARRDESSSGSGATQSDESSSGSEDPVQQQPPDESAAGKTTSDAGGQAEAPDPEPLFRSATRKWVQGNPEGAIEDCSRALEAGYTPCYRVIGMAQKQRGNTPEACRHFEEYVATEPDDARKIRRQMEELGCRGAGAE